ncbi:hypothetical protein QR680_009582 [Steinernema hermaphroditum]|uniref:dolichyl-phosphate-mannose--protein mannosyltransferase n=1 Tax=Steinernema hermaphroditum TaxID=289476 RepID=A0AA39IKV8_9BILA|nr:hypothetical protein QR680_009582 [Steinernema hermaphroditum]
MRKRPRSPPRSASDVVSAKQWLLVATAATVCFLPSLDGHFVFDDAEAIVRNPVVQQMDLVGLLKTDFWGRDVRAPESHKSFRPVTTFTFLLNRVFSPSPLPFHAANVVLHVAVSLLLLGLLAQLCRRFGVSANVAFYAALLFGVHPIHSEAVANVVGRAELLMACFGLLALLLYTRCEERFSRTKTLLFASLLVLSTFSKEQGVTFLAISVLYDILRPGVASTDANNNDRTVARVRKRTIFCGLFLVFLCFVRLWINGFQYPRFSKLDNPAAFHEDLPVRVANYFYQYLINLWLLIFPRDLCFDYSMGCIPLITSLRDPRLLFFATYPVLGASLLLLKERLSVPEFSLAFFSLGWTFLAFLPATNVVSVGFVVAERVLYVPSVGFCLLVGTLLHRLEASIGSPKVKQLASIACILMVSKCISRSFEWRTEKELFAAGLAVCPNNAKIHYNLGKALADGGDFASAEKSYRSALSLRPDYEQALNNMANLLERRGDRDGAIRLLQKSVSANGHFATAWMNLGVNQMAIGDYGRAERSLANALRLRPRNADAYFNLGNLYLKQKRYVEAERCWRNATLIQPNHHMSWTNLLVVLDEQNECSEVEFLAKTALEQPLGNAEPVKFQLALCQAKLRKFVEAERNLLSLVESRPENALYRMNLGVLYERWKKPRKAIEAYQKASEMNLGHVKVGERLRRLQKKMKLLIDAAVMLSQSAGTVASSGKKLISLIVGQEAELLEKKTVENYTHRWKVYVRTPGPQQPSDRSFISKVVFKLHPDFKNPERIVKRPPFEVNEAGYGGFTINVMVYFADEMVKPFSFNYDLFLSFEKTTCYRRPQILALPDRVSREFLEMIPKYCSGSTSPRTKEHHSKESSRSGKTPGGDREERRSKKKDKREKERENCSSTSMPPKAPSSSTHKSSSRQYASDDKVVTGGVQESSSKKDRRSGGVASGDSSPTSSVSSLFIEKKPKAAYKASSDVVVGSPAKRSQKTEKLKKSKEAKETGRATPPSSASGTPREKKSGRIAENDLFSTALQNCASQKSAELRKRKHESVEQLFSEKKPRPSPSGVAPGSRLSVPQMNGSRPPSRISEKKVPTPSLPKNRHPGKKTPEGARGGSPLIRKPNTPLVESPTPSTPISSIASGSSSSSASPSSASPVASPPSPCVFPGHFDLSSSPCPSDSESVDIETLSGLIASMTDPAAVLKVADFLISSESAHLVNIVNDSLECDLRELNPSLLPSLYRICFEQSR